MIENVIFDLEAIFEEIVERGIDEGVNSEEAYRQLVEEVIEEHREVAELHDDQNLEAYEDSLKGRYKEYEERLAAGG